MPFQLAKSFLFFLDRFGAISSSMTAAGLLWVDKYRPKTLDTLDIHPEWTDKLAR